MSRKEGIYMTNVCQNKIHYLLCHSERSEESTLFVIWRRDTSLVLHDRMK